MKRKLLILIGVVLILLGSTVIYVMNQSKPQERVYTKIEFGKITTNLEDAKYIAIENNKKVAKSKNGLFGTVVHASSHDYSHVQDNELVVVDSNDEVNKMKFTNEANKEIDLGYTPLYIENIGDFTLTIAVHDSIFEKNSYYYSYQDKLQSFLPLVLSSDDPISSMFSTGVSDIGYHISAPFYVDYDSLLNLLIVNNKNGKIYDLSSTLFEGLDKDVQNNLRVDNLFVHDNKLVFSVHYEMNIKYPEIITFEYNDETEDFKRITYSPETPLSNFTPVLTDQYFNTLYISNYQYKILKEDLTIYDIPEEIKYQNSEFFLIDQELYFITFFSELDEIHLGKINENSQYERVSRITINQSRFTQYNDYFNHIKNYMRNEINNRDHYYDIESFGYKSFIKDNMFYYISVGDGFSHRSIALEIGNDGETFDTGIHLLDLEVYPGRGFFVEDQLFFINESEIGYYEHLNNQNKEILISNIEVQDYHQNLFYYFDEHIGVLVKDLNDSQMKYVLINILTGEVLFDQELNENQISYKTEIKLP